MRERRALDVCIEELAALQAVGLERLSLQDRYIMSAIYSIIEDSDIHHNMLLDYLLELDIVKDNRELAEKLSACKDKKDQFALIELRSKYLQRHLEDGNFVPLINAAVEATATDSVDKEMILTVVFNYLDQRGTIENEDIKRYVKHARIKLLAESIKKLFVDLANKVEVSLLEIEKELADLRQIHTNQYQEDMQGHEIHHYSADVMPNLHKLLCCLKVQSSGMKHSDAAKKLYGWDGRLFAQFIKSCDTEDLRLLFSLAPYAAYVPIGTNFFLAHFPVVFGEQNCEKFAALFCDGGLQPAYFSSQNYDALSYYFDDDFKLHDQEIIGRFFRLANVEIACRYLEDSMNKKMNQSLNAIIHSQVQIITYGNVDHILHDYLDGFFSRMKSYAEIKDVASNINAIKSPEVIIAEEDGIDRAPRLQRNINLRSHRRSIYSEASVLPFEGDLFAEDEVDRVTGSGGSNYEHPEDSWYNYLTSCFRSSDSSVISRSS